MADIAVKDLQARFAALTDDKGYSSDPELISPWLTDWRGRYHGKAMAMLSPRTSHEVAAIIRLAAENGIAIVAQGGNSGMVGGATPDDSGQAILLSLRRMSEIRNFDIAARQITLEAGVILQNLHAMATDKDLRFPLTLGGKGSATIGGLVSTNAGGSQVLRHGPMRDLTLGIEAVLADGQIYHGLSPLKKDNRGPDLKHLLIGAEGTLGIVTAATLKLSPALADRSVVWAGLSSTAQARALFCHIYDRAGSAMEGFEILPQRCLESVQAYLPDARAPLQGRYPWHVLIELVREQGGPDAQPTPHALAETIMAETFEQGLAEDAALSQNESQAEAFWLIRESISPAEKARAASIQHDISVPVEKMADFIDHASTGIEARFADVGTLAFGHMGDGNVHFHVYARDKVDRERWPEAASKRISPVLHDMVVDWGGSISAEHGIGQMKRDELARLDDPARLAMLRAIKSALDPANILNPGKLI